MNLQRIADDLHYHRDKCEHCNGQGYHRSGSMCINCKGRGCLWYPKQHPAIPRPLMAGLTDERLVERWQPQQASQRP
jgi:DnaJ-class molecular chaperone